MKKVKVLVNRRGHIDVRNALGWWSLVKEIFDLAFIIFGGGTMLKMPSVQLTSFIFLIWLWSVMKVVADTPLSLLWLFGKIDHIKRERQKRKHKREKQKMLNGPGIK